MYNGHKNWNHWNVSLWLFNEEVNYSYVQEVIKKETLDDSAKILSHIMKGFIYSFKNGRYVIEAPGLDMRGNEIEERTTPDGAPWTITAIRSALVGVRG